MAKVTLDLIYDELVQLRGQLKLSEPVPASGPITMNQALRMTEQDANLSFSVSGGKIHFAKKYPFGEQKWSRPLAR